MQTVESHRSIYTTPPEQIFDDIIDQCLDTIGDITTLPGPYKPGWAVLAETISRRESIREAFQEYCSVSEDSEERFRHECMKNYIHQLYIESEILIQAYLKEIARLPRPALSKLLRRIVGLDKDPRRGKFWNKVYETEGKWLTPKVVWKSIKRAEELGRGDDVGEEEMMGEARRYLKDFPRSSWARDVLKKTVTTNRAIIYPEALD